MQGHSFGDRIGEWGTVLGTTFAVCLLLTFPLMVVYVGVTGLIGRLKKQNPRRHWRTALAVCFLLSLALLCGFSMWAASFSD